MTFEVEIDEMIQTVTLESMGAVGPAGGTFRVTLARPSGPGATLSATETTMVVEVGRSEWGLSLLYPQDGRSVDVAMTERPGGDVFVQLPHVDLLAVVDGRRLRRSAPDSRGTGAQRIAAPMPGRVLRVQAAPGDQVVAGQTLIVIEAMKMENELKALRAGWVREVLTSEGSSVEAGRLLLVIDAGAPQP